MRFAQHIDPKNIPWLAKIGVKPIVFDFCSLNEFMRQPLIQIVTKDLNFKRFTICRAGWEYELISELKDGKTFKLGVLDGNMNEIPEWCGQKIIISRNIPKDIERKIGR